MPRRLRHLHIVCVATVFCTLAAGTVPEGAQLSSELRLSSLTQKLGGSPACTRHMVRDMAYSPDGKWIALVLGHVWHLRECAENPDEVLLLSVEATAERTKRFTLDTCARDSWSRVLYWSPDGQHVAVLTDLLHRRLQILSVMEGKQCEIGHFWRFGGFIDDRRMVLAFDDRSLSRRFATRLPILLYNTGCEEVGKWPLVAPIDGLAAFGPPGKAWVYNGASMQAITDSSGKVMQQLPLDQVGPIARFGDSGKVLCQAEPPGNYAQQVKCYDAETGTRILPGPPARTVAPFDVARDRAVIVATDAYRTNTLLGYNSVLHIESWIVWDLRQGREVARIKHGEQGSSLKFTKRDRVSVEPIRAAISPDARHLATGMDDVLRIYDLPAQPGSSLGDKFR
jgi:hypothetical protein